MRLPLFRVNLFELPPPHLQRQPLVRLEDHNQLRLLPHLHASRQCAPLGHLPSVLQHSDPNGPIPYVLHHNVSQCDPHGLLCETLFDHRSHQWQERILQRVVIGEGNQAMQPLQDDHDVDSLTQRKKPTRKLQLVQMVVCDHPQRSLHLSEGLAWVASDLQLQVPWLAVPYDLLNLLAFDQASDLEGQILDQWEAPFDLELQSEWAHRCGRDSLHLCALSPLPEVA